MEKFLNQKTNGQNKETITRARLVNSPPLPENIAQSTFRKSCTVEISITATAHAVITNEQNQNTPMYIVQKDVSKFPNYFGWDSTGSYKINQSLVPEPFGDKTMTMLIRHRPIMDIIIREAVAHHYQYDHVSILLTSNHWVQINKMDEFSKTIVSEYGIILPMIGFAFNSKNELYITINGRSFMQRPEIFELMGQMEDYLKNSLPGIFDNVECNSENNIYSWTLKFKCKQKSLHICYDVIKLICLQLGIEKPFIICVSGNLADRAATFKDSKHEMFLTHMYTNFKVDHKNPLKTSSIAAIIQKCGRICGKDNNSHVPRTMYMNLECKQVFDSAIQDNKTFVNFMEQNRGKTPNETLQLAGELEMPLFRNILQNVSWHKPKFSKVSNPAIACRLPREYVQQCLLPPQQAHTGPSNDGLYLNNIEKMKPSQISAVVKALYNLNMTATRSEIFNYLKDNDFLILFKNEKPVERTNNDFVCQFSNQDNIKNRISNILSTSIFIKKGEKSGNEFRFNLKINM
jgi:hypothetical protein